LRENKNKYLQYFDIATDMLLCFKSNKEISEKTGLSKNQTTMLIARLFKFHGVRSRRGFYMCVKKLPDLSKVKND
jgi:hypothetical protein